jgi:methionine-gamma-lyase
MSGTTMRQAVGTGFATRAIHAGHDPAEHQGALVPPIHVTTTFAFPDAATGARRFTGEAPGHVYTRLGNPTLALLETRLAALEGGEAALVTGSGMGAITAALWTLVEPGDEILVDQTLYGCTFAFLHHGIGRFGVAVRHVDLSEPERLPALIGPRTRIVYCETPANPDMRLVDIEAVAGVAHAAGALLLVDNTYATPWLQRPLAMGADLVLHSATKYLAGHGDVMAGAVVGGKALIDRIRLTGLKDMTGAVLGPLDAFLVLRGLKTLELRMERHCATAMAVACLLEDHPATSRVLYPGLPSFPQHDLACRQMRGFGGMIALELEGGAAAALRFMDALTLVTRAVSLGDAESLVQHPASMTHSTYTAEERARFGIGDGLVRLSIGLETPSDLLADVGRALEAAYMPGRLRAA